MHRGINLLANYIKEQMLIASSIEECFIIDEHIATQKALTSHA